MKQLLALLSGLFLMASTNVQAQQVKSKKYKVEVRKRTHRGKAKRKALKENKHKRIAFVMPLMGRQKDKNC